MQELKRKVDPQGSELNGVKRKKGGNSGKWQTPHQRSKADQRGVVEPGDTGIWVTCARSQEAKAAREVQLLFDEYAEKLYDVKPLEDAAASDDGGADGDIEASIQKELTSLKPGNSTERPRGAFTILRQSVDCLLFVRTREPIEPVEFSRRICLDAQQAVDPKDRRCRYLNRFTPITLVGRASEKGVQEVCERVLPQWFALKPSQDGRDDGEAARDSNYEQSSGVVEATSVAASIPDKDERKQSAYTYAIRATSRNQSPLKREDVIKRIAGMIDDRHKVNLGSPDKVILVDMYQNVYGMSVVDGDWEELKRYNISEIYSHATKKSSGVEVARAGAGAPEGGGAGI